MAQLACSTPVSRSSCVRAAGCELEQQQEHQRHRGTEAAPAAGGVASQEICESLLQSAYAMLCPKHKWQGCNASATALCHIRNQHVMSAMGLQLHGSVRVCTCAWPNRHPRRVCCRCRRVTHVAMRHICCSCCLASQLAEGLLYWRVLMQR
jgi:hypothetical protein